MSNAERICEWITQKVNEGRGAVVFGLEEYAGMVGVWVDNGNGKEGEFGYGDDAFDAVLDAISRDGSGGVNYEERYINEPIDIDAVFVSIKQYDVHGEEISVLNISLPQHQ